MKKLTRNEEKVISYLTVKFGKNTKFELDQNEIDLISENIELNANTVKKVLKALESREIIKNDNNLYHISTEPDDTSEIKTDTENLSTIDNIEFVKLVGRIKDNISTIFIELKITNATLIESQKKINEIIKRYYEEEANANNCKLLYSQLLPIFRSIKAFNPENDEEKKYRRLLLGNAKEICLKLTSEKYPNKIFYNFSDILSSVQYIIDIIYEHSESDKYILKQCISISNGIRNFINDNADIANYHIKGYEKNEQVIKLFEDISNAYLTKFNLPRIQPLYHYDEFIIKKMY